MANQSPRGTYLDIARALREEIERGVFLPGAALPSEASLVRRFGVARETVRRGLVALRDDGIVSNAQGKGWFVGREPSALPTSLLPVLVDLRKLIGMDFQHGDRFYSESDLVMKYGISRHQVRQVLARLESDGLLITRKGTGRFVNITPSGGARA